MANPASKKCIDVGGTLEMQEEPEGQYGVCVFSDGSRCDEWAFFRGEGTPGSCTEHNGRCQETPANGTPLLGRPSAKAPLTPSDQTSR